MLTLLGVGSAGQGLPTLTSLSPVNGATGVSTTTNLVLTFDQDMTPQSGADNNIDIYSTAAGVAAQFTHGNSEKLTYSPGSHADWAFDDSGWWMACWVYLDNLTNGHGIAGRYSYASGSGGMAIHVDATNGRVVVSFANHPSYNQPSFTGLSAGQWYHLFVWHDPTANTANLMVDGVLKTSNSYTAGLAVATSVDFNVGYHNQTGNYGSHRIDAVVVGKTPTSITSLASTISAALYNSGNGKSISSLTAQQKSDWGVLHGYDLEETSGTRADAIGSHDLTDNNTVTSATGKTAVTTLVESIDAQDAKVTGGGTSTITINPAATLDSAKDHYVLIGADALDGPGGSWGGITSSTTWAFTTA